MKNLFFIIIGCFLLKNNSAPKDDGDIATHTQAVKKEDLKNITLLYREVNALYSLNLHLEYSLKS
jgi:hypothetical protein